MYLPEQIVGVGVGGAIIASWVSLPLRPNLRWVRMKKVGRVYGIVYDAAEG